MTIFQSLHSDERLFFQQPINFEISDAKVQSLKIAFHKFHYRQKSRRRRSFYNSLPIGTKRHTGNCHARVVGPPISDFQIA